VRPPETIAVHFLYSLAHRKALIERKLELRRVKSGGSTDRPTAPDSTAGDTIHLRLARISNPAGNGEGAPAR
jgi:hypothetical protein